MACPGHRPHAQAQPLPKIVRGDGQSWDIPCRGEPTRQEPALLANHDAAAAPGPARLCNDLKQESRVTGPHTLSNMGHKVRGGDEEGGRNLEPGTWISTSPQLSTRRLLDYPTLNAQRRRAPIHLSPPLVLMTLLVTPLPHSETRSRLLLLLPPLLLQTSQPPDGTWLNAGSVMLCLTRPLIAHQPPPFDAASMGNRSGRQMFAYGCPLNNKMGFSFILSLVYASCATEYWGLQCLHCPHSLPYIVCPLYCPLDYPTIQPSRPSYPELRLHIHP